MEHVHKGNNKRTFRQRIEDVGGKGAEMENDNDEPIDLSDEDDDGHSTLRSGTGGSNRGRRKRSSDTKSVPRIEETMSEFLSFRKEQVNAKRQSKRQERDQERDCKITRCLEVLDVMDDVSNKTKILASDVLKDATNHELFLGYAPRLRGQL